MARCSLCGGQLNLEKRCTLCGLDNTKNDGQYKHLFNKNNHEDTPLTHVHTEPSMYKYEQIADYTKKAAKQAKSFVEQYSNTTYQRNKKSEKRQDASRDKKAGKIIAVIIAVFGLLPSLFSLVSEIGHEDIVVDVQDATYEAYLDAGMYGVGTHIPEGTYNIAIDAGEYGSVEVLEYVDGFVNTVDYYFLDIEEEEFVEGISLMEGQILCISEEMTAWIYSWDAEEFATAYEENALTESFVITGKATAGIDFPEGVYDIIYMPEVENEYGNANIVLWNSEMGRSSMEKTIYLDTYRGYTVYRNVPFTKDSMIWLQDLAQIEITPSEYIGVSE